MREKYVELSLEYFKGDTTLEELIAELKKFIIITVDKINIPTSERVLLISNHPTANSNLSLPAECIAGLKGGNTNNFPDFWFPVVRQMMLRQALQRRFFTLAHKIGWPVAMQEMWHLLIQPTGNGRCKEIISQMEDDASSLVIFPEGGVRNLEIFRTGFFYIACELRIKYLVVGAFSQILSLEKENVFKVLHIEDMSRFIDPVNQFVQSQKRILKNGIPI